MTTQTHCAARISNPRTIDSTSFPIAQPTSFEQNGTVQPLICMPLHLICHVSAPELAHLHDGSKSNVMKRLSTLSCEITYSDNIHAACQQSRLESQRPKACGSPESSQGSCTGLELDRGVWVAFRTEHELSRVQAACYPSQVEP
jgi:hypothetical protein